MSIKFNFKNPNISTSFSFTNAFEKQDQLQTIGRAIGTIFGDFMTSKAHTQEAMDKYNEAGIWFGRIVPKESLPSEDQIKAFKTILTTVITEGKSVEFKSDTKLDQQWLKVMSQAGIIPNEQNSELNFLFPYNTALYISIKKNQIDIQILLTSP